MGAYLSEHVSTLHGKLKHDLICFSLYFPLVASGAPAGLLCSVLGQMADWLLGSRMTMLLQKASQWGRQRKNGATVWHRGCDKNKKLVY